MKEEEEKKGKEEIKYPRYTNSLVCEMMQLGNLLNEYKIKVNVTIEAKNDLLKLWKKIKK